MSFLADVKIEASRRKTNISILHEPVRRLMCGHSDRELYPAANLRICEVDSIANRFVEARGDDVGGFEFCAGQVGSKNDVSKYLWP